MAITLAQAKLHLNIDATDTTDDDELQFFVDAANEWIATQVGSADLAAKPVELATRELVRHWWAMSQLGPMDVPEPGDDIGLIGLRVPPFVHEMLGPYLTGNASASPPAPVGSFPAAASWPDPVCW